MVQRGRELAVRGGAHPHLVLLHCGKRGVRVGAFLGGREGGGEGGSKQAIGMCLCVCVCVCVWGGKQLG